MCQSSIRIQNTYIHVWYIRRYLWKFSLKIKCIRGGGGEKSVCNQTFNFTAAVVSTSGEEDQELEKGNLEFTWKDAWLFLFPAVCDVTATSGPIFL